MQDLSGEFVFEELKLEILTIKLDNSQRVREQIWNYSHNKYLRQHSGVVIKGMLNQFKVVMQS